MTVLVWNHDGRAYCRARCIIASTGLFDKGRDWTGVGWFDRQAKWKNAVARGDRAIDRFITSSGDDDFTIRYARRQVIRGHWPLPRYETRRHFAADVAHMRCSQCGQPFRKAMPATESTRREKSKWHKARERMRLARDRAYRAARPAHTTSRVPATLFV